MACLTQTTDGIPTVSYARILISGCHQHEGKDMLETIIFVFLFWSSKSPRRNLATFSLLLQSMHDFLNFSLQINPMK